MLGKVNLQKVNLIVIHVQLFLTIAILKKKKLINQQLLEHQLKIDNLFAKHY